MEQKTSSVKLLYISSERKVYKIPQPKGNIYKAIPELAEQEVLIVSLIYEIRERKPWRLITMYFDRIELDKQGQYQWTKEEMSSKMHNAIHFGFTTPEELSERTQVVIPEAPVNPTKFEIEVLKEYLKTQEPNLWKNSPEILGFSIRANEVVYKKLKNMVKKASEIKRRTKKGKS